MVICKFFAQGRCRYGDHCKFEHVSDEGGGGGTSWGGLTEESSDYGHQYGHSATNYHGNRYEALTAYNDEYEYSDQNSSYGQNQARGHYGGQYRDSNYGGQARDYGGQRGDDGGYRGRGGVSRNLDSVQDRFSYNKYDNRGRKDGNTFTSLDRNDHSANSKYRYRAENYGQQSSSLASTPSISSVGLHPEKIQGDYAGYNADEVLAVIVDDVNTWENSNMWPFSCFAFTKDTKSFPGLEDISFEEVRLAAYEANSTGKGDAYKSWIALLVNDYKIKKQELLNLSKLPRWQIDQLLRELADSNSSTLLSSTHSNQINPSLSSWQLFSNNYPNSNCGTLPATSTNHKTTIFSETDTFGTLSAPSLFGSFSTTVENASAVASSAFGFSSIASSSGASSAPGSSALAFGATQANYHNFGQSSGSIFGTGSIVPSPQSSGLFGSANASSGQQDFFGSNNNNVQHPPAQSGSGAATLFGNGTQAAQSQSNSSVGGCLLASNGALYSNLAELSEADRKAFETNRFIFGKVPVRPPPKELI